MAIELKNDHINYLVASHLIFRVAPKALVNLLDRHYHGGIENVLKREKNKIDILKNEGIITEDDWTKLAAISECEDNVDYARSFENLGTRLILILIEALTALKIPTWRPDPLNTSVPANLYRIEFTLNYIIKLRVDCIADDTFQGISQELIMSIERLGGFSISMQSDVINEPNTDVLLKTIQKEKEIFSLNDVVPKDRKDSIERKLKKWKENDVHFISTFATKAIIDKIKDNQFVAITGDYGTGKTCTLRHIALQLNLNEGYDVIKIKNISDVIRFYGERQRKVFIIDNFCGYITPDQQCIFDWAGIFDVIEDKCRQNKRIRIIITCVSQIFESKQFLKVFRNTNAYECRLLSLFFGPNIQEKRSLVSAYIGETNLKRLEPDILVDFPIFLRFCQLRANVNVWNKLNRFKDAAEVFDNELQTVCDTDKWAFFILTLLVVFDNKLDKRLFNGKLSNCEENVIDDVCSNCSLKDHPTMMFIAFRLQTLMGIFIVEGNTYIRAITGAAFNRICQFVGKNKSALRSIIKHGSSTFINQRLQLNSIYEEKNDFTILVPFELQELFFSRQMKDMKEGKIWEVLSAAQTMYKQYRSMFLTFLQKHMTDKCLAENSQTALCVSAFIGYNDFVAFFFTIASDVETSTSENGLQALHAASMMDHQSIVELLLTSSVVNLSTLSILSSNSPLYLASKCGNTGVVQTLLNLNAGVYYTGKDQLTALFAACQRGHANVVELLLKIGAYVNECTIEGITPLHAASRKHYPDVFKLLLENDTNAHRRNKCEITALLMACEEGHVDVVNLLLSSSKYSTEQDYLALLHVACKNGHVPVTEILLKRGIDVNSMKKGGSTPLYIASKEGHSAVVEVLMRYSANANLPNADGSKSLYIASLQGHTEVVKSLLEKINDINEVIYRGRTALHIACQEGNSVIVAVLLANKADVSKWDESGKFPLYIACENGYEDVVDLLLQNNTNVNQCTEMGHLSLQIACQKSHLTIVSKLVKAGADPYMVTEKELSPMFHMCNEGNLTIVDIFLNHKVSPNENFANEHTPLSFACLKGNLGLIKLLLNYGVDVMHMPKIGRPSLFIACDHNHIELVDLLLKHKADPDQRTREGFFSLYLVTEKGNCELTGLLLKYKADPNLQLRKGSAPLHAASVSNNTAVALLLIKNGADVNLSTSGGGTPLYFATQNNHVPMVTLLIQYNALVNKASDDGVTPLYKACEMGHARIVKILIKNKADINLCRKGGFSPLYTSCEMGHTKIVTVLLKHGANLNKTNSGGFSPLHIVCKENHGDIVKILVNNFESVDLSDDNGFSPLHVACTYNHLSIAKFLLNCNADVSYKSKDGITPLHIASKRGHIELVTLLLRNDANVNIVDDKGYSALYFACDGGHLNIAKLLIKRDARINQKTKFKANPLCIACARGHVKIVDLLLKHFADVNIVTSKGKTPLSLAHEYGHEDIVERLLDRDRVTSRSKFVNQDITEGKNGKTEDDGKSYDGDLSVTNNNLRDNETCIIF